MTLAISPLLLHDGMNKLTVKQLRRASYDLIEAASEIAERGHHRWSMISGATGAVCIGGAIELVTYRRHGKVGRIHGLFDREADNLDELKYNADNAATVLAGTVHHLCECNEERGGPWSVIAHYNDHHCPGGVVAYNLLRIAAARALVLAEHKHDLLKEYTAQAVQ